MTVPGAPPRNDESLPKWSVVVPVHDEEENVAALLEEIRAALESEGDYEVIYVDDGSLDGTFDVLAALARETPELRLVRHSRCFGQSAAIWSGVRAARAPWVVTLDGDGQNDPRDIPRLLGVLDDPSSPPDLDLVAGIRRERRDSWSKRISSRIANAVRSALLRDGVRDTGCGLKVIRRDAFLTLPPFDHMHRFLPALIRRGGGSLRTVDVSHRHRRAGRSKYGLWNRLGVGIVDLIGVLWLRRRPLAPQRCVEHLPANEDTRA